MNFRTRQVQRTQLIRWFESLPMLLVRLIAYGIGVMALTYLGCSLFMVVSLTAQAICYLALSPMIAIGSYELYIKYLKGHPEYLHKDIEKDVNILNACDYQVIEVLLRWRRNQNWSGLLSGLLRINDVQELFYRLDIPREALEAMKIEANEAYVVNLLAETKKNLISGELIDIHSLIRTLIFREEFSGLLQSHKLSAASIEATINYFHHRKNVIKIIKGYWLRPRAHHTGGFAKDWAVGYTPILDVLSSEIPPDIDRRALIYPLYSRQNVLDATIVELGKSKSGNILLVGESGSGRTEIVYHLASKIIHHETGTSIDGHHVRVLEVQRLISGSRSPEELKGLLDRLFSELARVGNVLLFIDGLEYLINTSDELGSANASGLLGSYLENPDLKIVATITKEVYLKYVRTNPAFNDSFSVLEVSAPNAIDLLSILLSQVSAFENRFHVVFTVESLDAIITLAARYFKDEVAPSRELRLLEEVAIDAHAHKNVIIEEKDVISVVERKAQVPIQVQEKDRSKLINLESELHKRVVGQDRPIKLVSEALLRSRAGLSGDKRPIGAFLFLGPTGVGKTETAKTLADVYFGSQNRMVRLDMTEYADSNGLQKLLGTDSKNDPGALALSIQKNPSTVVLLDEIEKSHQFVKNAFLQVLDEGRLTTNYGKVLDFTNSIIVATSNAGSDLIRRQVSSGVDVANFEKQLIDQLMTEKIFSPEFINRFDAAVVYRPLTQVEIRKVVEIRLSELIANLKEEKGISLEIAPGVIEELAKRGYDPVFGARALERVIKENLETVIAKKIVTEQPASGAVLTIDQI